MCHSFEGTVEPRIARFKFLLVYGRSQCLDTPRGLDKPTWWFWIPHEFIIIVNCFWFGTCQKYCLQGGSSNWLKPPKGGKCFYPPIQVYAVCKYFYCLMKLLSIASCASQTEIFSSNVDTKKMNKIYATTTIMIIIVVGPDLEPEIMAADAANIQLVPSETSIDEADVPANTIDTPSTTDQVELSSPAHQASSDLPTVAGMEEHITMTCQDPRISTMALEQLSATPIGENQPNNPGN